MERYKWLQLFQNYLDKNTVPANPASQATSAASGYASSNFAYLWKEVWCLFVSFFSFFPFFAHGVTEDLILPDLQLPQPHSLHHLRVHQDPSPGGNMFFLIPSMQDTLHLVSIRQVYRPIPSSASPNVPNPFWQLHCVRLFWIRTNRSVRRTLQHRQNASRSIFLQ